MREICQQFKILLYFFIHFNKLQFQSHFKLTAKINHFIFIFQSFDSEHISFHYQQSPLIERGDIFTLF